MPGRLFIVVALVAIPLISNARISHDAPNSEIVAATVESAECNANDFNISVTQYARGGDDGKLTEVTPVKRKLSISEENCKGMMGFLSEASKRCENVRIIGKVDLEKNSVELLDTGTVKALSCK